MEEVNFLYQESALNTIKHGIRTALFQKITSNGPNLFLRGRDLISIDPHVSGLHEPVITKLISYLASKGYDDFLIDVGANIGLTSCQNGVNFKFVHMFEPNPLCCRILEVNAAIALDESSYKIHQVGLGEREGLVRLTVPRDNWGGAFINDTGNSYDADTLVNKDRFTSFDKKNYFDIDIVIQEAADTLKRLFAELANNGLVNGVIKLDVEGYEPVILKGIAQTLPHNMSVMIIFESWSEKFDVIKETLEVFNNRATAYRLSSNRNWKRHWSRVRKAISLVLGGKVVVKTEAVDYGPWVGDVLLKVKHG